MDGIALWTMGFGHLTFLVKLNCPRTIRTIEMILVILPPSYWVSYIYFNKKSEIVKYFKVFEGHLGRVPPRATAPSSRANRSGSEGCLCWSGT